MARPIRILFKGAYYHVVNRGHRKTEIFLEDADYRKFLEVIKDACEIYKVKIVAYCLTGSAGERGQSLSGVI